MLPFIEEGGLLKWWKQKPRELNQSSEGGAKSWKPGLLPSFTEFILKSNQGSLPGVHLARFSNCFGQVKPFFPTPPLFLTGIARTLKLCMSHYCMLIMLEAGHLFL